MLPVLNHCHEWTPLIEIERKYRYHQQKLRSTYYRQRERNGKCCKCLSSSSSIANSSTSMSLLCSSSFHQVHEGHTPSFHFTFFLIFLCFFFFFLRFYFLLNFDKYHKMYYIPARMDGFFLKKICLWWIHF